MNFCFVGRIILLAGIFHTASWLIIVYFTIRREWATMDRFGPALVKASIAFPVLILVPYFIAAYAGACALNGPQERRKFPTQWIKYVLLPWLIYVLLLFTSVTLFERAAWFAYPPLALGIAMVFYGRWVIQHFPESAGPQL